MHLTIKIMTEQVSIGAIFAIVLLLLSKERVILKNTWQLCQHHVKVMHFLYVLPSIITIIIAFFCIGFLTFLCWLIILSWAISKLKWNFPLIIPILKHWWYHFDTKAWVSMTPWFSLLMQCSTLAVSRNIWIMNLSSVILLSDEHRQGCAVFYKETHYLDQSCDTPNKIRGHVSIWDSGECCLKS